MMELISEAIIFAVQAHDGMRRKQSKGPYILHPMEAAAIVGSITDDQEVIAAAALHDVVEDAGITLDQIEVAFGKRVRDLVACETEDKYVHLPPSTSWQTRKEESLEVLKTAKDPNVQVVWLGDKLANMRSFYREHKQLGLAMWERFNQKDPKAQAWYYRTIAQLTSSLSHTAAWQEYDKLTNLVFSEEE